MPAVWLIVLVVCLILLFGVGGALVSHLLWILLVVALIGVAVYAIPRR